MEGIDKPEKRISQGLINLIWPHQRFIANNLIRPIPTNSFIKIMSEGRQKNLNSQIKGMYDLF